MLLHGFGGDLGNWLFNQEPLSAGGGEVGRTVIALDLPGHGESSKDVGAGDVAALAAAVGDRLGLLCAGGQPRHRRHGAAERGKRVDRADSSLSGPLDGDPLSGIT